MRLPGDGKSDVGELFGVREPFLRKRLLAGMSQLIDDTYSGNIARKDHPKSYFGMKM